MSFQQEFPKFAKQVASIANYVKNRETVKQSVVVPLMRLLGWDVYNPAEFLPAFTPEIPGIEPASIDFAVLYEGKPVLLLQTFYKSDEVVESFESLALAFAATEAAAAILTDGTRWRFFADTETPRKLDEKPFYEIFDIKLIDDMSLHFLGKIEKSAFNPNFTEPFKIGKIETALRVWLGRQTSAETLDDDLVRFVFEKAVGKPCPPALFARMKEVILKQLGTAKPIAAPAEPARPAATPSIKKMPEPIKVPEDFAQPEHKPVHEEELQATITPLIEEQPETNKPAPVIIPAPKPVASEQAPELDLAALPDSDLQEIEARITVITGDDQGKSAEVKKNEFFIGRNLDMDLVLTDNTVSRRHFQILRQNGKFFVEDMGSGNKIKVNGVKTTERIQLENDDLVQAGNTTIRFEIYG